MNILQAACLTVLWVTSEPTAALRAAFGFTNLKYADMSKAKAFLHRLLNCAMCSGFWIGLAFTRDIGLAAVTALAAELITRKITNE